MFWKRLIGATVFVFTAIMAQLPGYCLAQVATGQPAPSFSLPDIEGKSYTLSDYKEKSMLVLYFFDAASKPSQEGLLALNQLYKEYGEADMHVLAITLSSQDAVRQFRSQTNPAFPILLDAGKVSDLYQARMILPTIYTLGPALQILDAFQGGGKSTEIMLTKIAERQLLRKKTLLAKSISSQVEKKDPTNLKAKTIKGYAALQGGDVPEAERIFTEMKGEAGEGNVLGDEGLAAVYFKKGQADKALAMAQSVEKSAPDRGYANVVKGNIYYSQNKMREAETEYRKATEKKKSEVFHDALTYNQLARFYAVNGDYKKSRELYDRAIDIDPGYIEATSNKGFTYEKEGNWDKALESYQKALTIDKNDTYSMILAQKAQEMLALQTDAEKKKRLDQLVHNLSERYRQQQKDQTRQEDTWTSRPMVMTFLYIEEKGGLSERDGFSTVITSQLANKLNGSGRVRVVERVLIDKLLEELNLGSSNLADPETTLRLGKVLAAKLIGTGSLYFLPDGTLLNLRFLDSETTVISKAITTQFGPHVSLEKEINTLNRDILQTVMTQYPLQGFIVQVADEEVLINLGEKQGIVLGTKLDVIEDQKPIEYKGKLLHSLAKPIGEIEIVRVEPELSHARITKRDRTLQSDDKVKEKIPTGTIPL